MNAQDIHAVPSLQDSLPHANNVRGCGFADEMPADAFPAEPEQSPEEAEAEYQWYMSREDERKVTARPALPGWHEAVCGDCNAALWVQDGYSGPAYCSECTEVREVDSTPVQTPRELITAASAGEA